MKDVIKRFEEKYIPEPNSGCWLWTASTHPFGYGSFRIEDKVFSAHRVSYELYCEPISNDMYVLHKCDNPYCVNPDHLFVGTQKENINDMINKNRRGDTSNCGEKNGNSKLTKSQVLEIYKDKRSNSVIAESYNIKRQNVWRIKNGKLWKGITNVF